LSAKTYAIALRCCEESAYLGWGFEVSWMTTDEALGKAEEVDMRRSRCRARVAAEARGGYVANFVIADIISTTQSTSALNWRLHALFSRLRMRQQQQQMRGQRAQTASSTLQQGLLETELWY
jgi:hypothetical protein